MGWRRLRMELQVMDWGSRLSRLTSCLRSVSLRALGNAF